MSDGTARDPLSAATAKAGPDTIGWFIATLHSQLGHDKAAAVIGQPPGDGAAGEAHHAVILGRPHQVRDARLQHPGQGHHLGGQKAPAPAAALDVRHDLLLPLGMAQGAHAVGNSGLAEPGAAPGRRHVPAEDDVV